MNTSLILELSSTPFAGECLPAFDVMTDVMTLDDTSNLNAFFIREYVALSLSIEKRDDTSFPRPSVINCRSQAHGRRLEGQISPLVALRGEIDCK